ncbi:MAG: hypothetical protein R3C49_25855 [Planctomycetaceae bacterium]
MNRLLLHFGRWILLVVPAIVSTASLATAQSSKAQLRVVEIIWGFDGRVQPGQFNPLSVLLDNQTSEAIEGRLILTGQTGMNSESGGRYVHELYLDPAQRRWVQFYPYVPHPFQTNWRLSLDAGDEWRNQEIAEITQARSATEELKDDDTSTWPQAVIFDRPDETTRQPITVKHLRENIFPPYASATTGLHTAFLDHDPDWEEPRRRAFLSWLKCGGRLYLLQDSRGEFPRFSGELSELNQPLSEFGVESGRVKRLSVRREQLTEGMVRNALQQEQTSTVDPDIERLLKQRQERGFSDLISLDASAMDAELFRRMKELISPDHLWWLIFLLALGYIGLIFPGVFVLSKQKQQHFLVPYAAIAGLSVVFSLLFLIIGRRGYGETTSLQTLALARCEDASHWNVFQWNTLFVTTGQEYRATAEDQQPVFAIADETGAVDADIISGSSGHAAMRIPPYSSQTFVSRRRTTGPDWNLKLVNVRTVGNRLSDLTIKTGVAFPHSQRARYHVVFGRHLYTLAFDLKSQTLSLSGQGQLLAEFCQPRFDYTYNFRNPWVPAEKPETRTEEEIFFDDGFETLLVRMMIDDLSIHSSDFHLPDDRLRLIVYTDIPEEFQLQLSTPANASGRILFIRDITYNPSATNSQITAPGVP